MYSCNKNSYLQGHFKNIYAYNSGLLNRSVQKALDGINITDEHDFDPPFNRLTSEQPHIPVENVDPSRRPEGFGRWAMPKLRRELHSKNPEVVVSALTSISDLVHDPERCFEAIRLNVIDRLVDLICHESPAIRERTAHTLKVLAGVALGKEAIVSNEALLANILERVEDEYIEVRLQIAACLEMVAKYWRAVDVLVNAGFIQVLLTNLFDTGEVVEIHLETLKSLLYCDGKKIALEEDGFQTLVKMFERDEGSILAKTCDVVVTFCMIKEGRKLAKQYNILPELNRLLHDERVEVHAPAAKAIMLCTIKSSEKIVASKLKTMPKRLVHLCKNKINYTAQMYAIKALTCICEHPLVRKEVNEKYYRDIEAIQLSDDIPEIQKFKNTLLSMLQWVPSTKE